MIANAGCGACGGAPSPPLALPAAVLRSAPCNHPRSQPSLNAVGVVWSWCFCRQHQRRQRLHTRELQKACRRRSGSTAPGALLHLFMRQGHHERRYLAEVSGQAAGCAAAGSALRTARLLAPACMQPTWPRTPCHHACSSTCAFHNVCFNTRRQQFEYYVDPSLPGGCRQVLRAVQRIWQRWHCWRTTVLLVCASTACAPQH